MFIAVRKVDKQLQINKRGRYTRALSYNVFCFQYVLCTKYIGKTLYIGLYKPVLRYLRNRMRPGPKKMNSLCPYNSCYLLALALRTNFRSRCFCLPSFCESHIRGTRSIIEYSHMLSFYRVFQVQLMLLWNVWCMLFEFMVMDITI